MAIPKMCCSSKPAAKSVLFVSVALLAFLFPERISAQINSTTPNNYFTPAAYQYFEMPTATDVVTMGSIPDLQVIVSTTPAPAIHWDDNNGHVGSLVVTTYGSNTVFFDDVVLTKSVSNLGPVAVITCREFLPNNTVNIRLVMAKWISNTFVLQPDLLLDNRANNSDWFDRVSISTHENGAESPTRQELFVTWQQAGKIWVSEGFMNFNTTTVSFYNTKVDVFPGLTGTLRHPDISRKTSSYKTIVAVQTLGSTQNLVAFDYQNAELAPTFVPSNSPAVATWYTTTAATTDVNTPRVEKGLKAFSVATATIVDNVAQRSIVALFGDVGTSNAASLNKGFELNCSGNTNYRKTGYPCIAITNNLPGSQFAVEIGWQQVICAGTDFCTIQALSKRYQFDPLGATIASLFGNQYFYLNADLTKNSCYPCIAALPTLCTNYYSFDLMDKTTSLNGKVTYKFSACNGSTVRESTNLVSTARGEAGITNTPAPEDPALKSRMVFPNPASNEVYADLRKDPGLFRVEMYGLSGSRTGSFLVTGGKVARLDVNGLPNGLYYLRFYLKGELLFTRKVTIVHQ